MAINSNINYKAHFCRLYFTQLKGFIRKFDVRQNNLGMEFLAQIDNQPFRWENDVKISDKSLMSAIEEYYHITDAEETLQEQREKLFSAMIDPDKYATDLNIKATFVDEVTLRAILCYFGLPERQEINDQISSFKAFAEAAAFGGGLLFVNFIKALHLFRLHRNDNAHNIIKQDILNRKIAFQYLAFTYIGLIYLMRNAWDTKEKRLNSYTKPDNFLIPKQTLRIVVNRKDSTNDTILGYTFVPNIEKYNEQVIKDVDPASELDFNVSVRKYDKFKLIVKYGNTDNQIVEIPFGSQGDKILSYYYWNPTLKINLPSSSSILPGLSIGSPSTEELISKLLDDVNKIQDGAAKQKISAITEEVLSALGPTLEKIKELSENLNKSPEDKEKKECLVKKVNCALQEQISKNDESFKKVLEKMEKLGDSQKKEFKNLSAKVDGHYKDIIENLNKLSKQINKEKQDTLQSDKALFWVGRHLPHYLAIVAAIVLFAYNIFYDCSLSYLEHKWMWIAMPVIISLILLLWTLYFYKRTVSNRISIIRPYTKWISLGLIAVALIIAVLTNLTIPSNTISKLASNYDFFAHHEIGDNARAAKLLENYLNDSDTTDEELVRVQLARYYLHFGNKSMAYKVIEPMINNPEKYKNGNLVAAEILYEQKDFEKVDDIIINYNDSHNPIIDRLHGLMYLFGGYDFDYERGVSLLKNAADSDDAIAQYWMGYLRSNDIRKDIPHYESEEKTYDVPSARFDLIEAIKYYRKSIEHNYPQAAVDLGSIYSDLNMTDSAKFYYNMAIDMSNERKIRNEAYFRMGILDERQKKSTNYMAKVESNYIPAKLHKAYLKEDHTQAIGILQKLGRYKGYRYIPPIVFEYAARNNEDEKDFQSALDTLNSTRPDGNFNMTFIKSLSALLKYTKTDIKLRESLRQKDDFKSGNNIINNRIDSLTFLKERDSITYINLLQQSAIEGCAYARMVVAFKKLYAYSNNIDTITSYADKIDALTLDLENIGREIPFSNVLLSWITKELGPTNFKKSEKYAQKAIRKGHPAGALVFTYFSEKYSGVIEGEISKFIKEKSFKDIFTNNWTASDSAKLIERYNNITMALRMSPPFWPFRSKNICAGQKIDKILSVLPYITSNSNMSLQPSYTDYPLEHLRFWCNVAIANHDLWGEIQMLNEYKMMLETEDISTDLVNREILLEAILNDLTFNEVEYENYPPIKPLCRFISIEARKLPQSFIKQMEQKYGNNKVAKEILEGKMGNGDIGMVGLGKPISTPWFYIQGDIALFNEFIDIIEQKDMSIIVGTESQCIQIK